MDLSGTSRWRPIDGLHDLLGRKELLQPLEAPDMHNLRTAKEEEARREIEAERNGREYWQTRANGRGMETGRDGTDRANDNKEFQRWMELVTQRVVQDKGIYGLEQDVHSAIKKMLREAI